MGMNPTQKQSRQLVAIGAAVGVMKRSKSTVWGSHNTLTYLRRRVLRTNNLLKSNNKIGAVPGLGVDPLEWTPDPLGRR